MPWPLLRRALDAFAGPPPRLVTVAFTGGEPLLAFDLVARAVRYVAESAVLRSRVRFALVSNGTRLDRAAAAFLAKSRVVLHLSDHGVPSAQRPGAEGPLTGLDAVLAAIAADHPLYFKLSVGVSLVVSSATAGTLAGSVDALVRRGVRRIDVAPLFTHDAGWSRATTAALDRQLALVHHRLLRHYEATGEVPLAAFRRHRAGGRAIPAGGPLCDVGAGRHLALDPWGLVSACPTAVASYQAGGGALLDRCLGALALGRLDDPAFPERLARLPRAARAVRLFDGREAKRSALGPCVSCAYASSCAVCPISIAHAPGATDPDRIPESQCAFFRCLGKWRSRFPVQAHPVDVLLGRAEGPPALARVSSLLRAFSEGAEKVEVDRAQPRS